MNILDVTGLICPEPTTRLSGALRGLEAGDVLYMLGDDPSSDRDVRRLCQYFGEHLVCINMVTKGYKKTYYYKIVKGL